MVTPESLPNRAVLVTDVQALNQVHLRSTEIWRAPDGSLREKELANVFFYKSVELEMPFEHNGRPLGRWQRSRENSEVRHLEEQIDQRWTGPQDNGKLVSFADEVWSTRDLLRNFQWSSEGSGDVHGHPATIFRYRPRPGIRPSNRVEHALARMYGRAWLDSQTGQVYRVEFHNQAPLKFGWGLLANFSSINGSFEMQPMGAVWVRGHTEVQLEGRELWNSLTGTVTKDYAPAN
jgi:hypothetical protein